MNTKKYQLESYRKYLLNRVTVSPSIIEYIENCVVREDEAGKHSFHKVMVLNWLNNEYIFDALSEYFVTPFVPVDFSTAGGVTSFYTSNLNLILKVVKQDFLFPYQRNMYNVDILFNDKTSADCFENRTTIEDIVSGVVSSRMSDKFELDLSNFCDDPELKAKKLQFYKISLLAQFKILMLRMGRDTRTLNLSNNNISQIPLEILNFFIRGDLIAVNLSNNNIPSLQELQRVSSKIEKLWIEGNPLCEDVHAMDYVKRVLMKFPRLIELDGIKLNQHGVIFPFFRNYLDPPDKKTTMLVEKFLTLYFSHYDTVLRPQIDMFYDECAEFSIITNFPDTTNNNIMRYTKHCRNYLQINRMGQIGNKPELLNQKLYRPRVNIVKVLQQLPDSIHDPTTFTVDVVKHDKKSLILIVDGVFKEAKAGLDPKRIFQFRRTFVFTVTSLNQSTTIYHIRNEIFNISLATPELIENSFKTPLRNMNELSLINPEPEECAAIVQAFSHLTQLKKNEAESRLKIFNWDINKALKAFIEDAQSYKISSDLYMEDDGLSDLSLDDDID